MHPILIDLGFFQVPSYGVLLATGVILALWTLRRRADRAGMDGARLVDFSLWLVIWALLGAKILLWERCGPEVSSSEVSLPRWWLRWCFSGDTSSLRSPPSTFSRRRWHSVTSSVGSAV